ncbi:MFS transporter [Enterobacter sp. BWH52]|uniref:MFS transporter n=1 Tax=Enterobacter sp. BWH52 TaxID=1686386 RepID=UPI0006512A4F|nr:MFS transporter [Enterobacter sp. BWH52]
MSQTIIKQIDKPTKKRISLLLILLLTITIAYFDRVNVTVLIADETFQKDLGIMGDPAAAGLIMTLFLIAYGVGNVVLSGLGDYLGARKTMVIAMLGWFIAMVIGGLAPTLMVMLISRFLLGLGEGLHFPTMNVFCRPWFPNHEKAKANAVWFIGTSLAPAFGLPVFVWLVANYSWHYTFILCAILGLIPMYFVWFHTADTPREHPTINQKEIDYIESGMPEPEQNDNTKKLTDTIKISFNLVSKNYLYWIMVIYYSIHNIVWWTLMTWLPTYLKAERGFSWTEMGVLASMPFILGIICKLLAGWASDKIGKRAPFCIIAMGGAAIMLYLSANEVNNWAAAIYILIAMGVITPGAPIMMTMLQEILPKNALSFGTGLLNGISYAVAALGPVVIGFIMSNYGSFSAALSLIIGLAVVGFICGIILTLRKF